MGIDLTGKLVQTATKIATSRNEYGDIIYGATSSSPCLYRDISTLNRGVGNREQVSIDGLLWFGATETVAKGDMYQLDGVYYRIERVINADRRVIDNSRQFIKCEVSKQRQIS